MLCSPGRQMTSAALCLLTGRMGPGRCLHNTAVSVRMEPNLYSPCMPDSHIINPLRLTPRHVLGYGCTSRLLFGYQLDLHVQQPDSGRAKEAQGLMSSLPAGAERAAAALLPGQQQGRRPSLRLALPEM